MNVNTGNVTGHFDEVAALLEALNPVVALRAAEVIDVARIAGRTVFVIGNGGSAATASHFAADISKNLKVPVRAMSFDNMSSLTAWANDMHYAFVFTEQLRLWAEPDDVLVYLSTSGNSPNILDANGCARNMGLRTIGLIGNVDSVLVVQNLVDTLVLTPHGSPEVVEDVHSVVCHAIVRLLKEMES